MQCARRSFCNPLDRKTWTPLLRLSRFKWTEPLLTEIVTRPLLSLYPLFGCAEDP